MNRFILAIILGGAALLPPFYPAAAQEIASAKPLVMPPVEEKKEKADELKKETPTAEKIVEKEKKDEVAKEAVKPVPVSFGRDFIGEERTYVTNYKDTLVQLARDNNIGFVELRSANPNVDPWLPGEGVKLVLPTRHLMPDAPRKGVVINLPEMRLYYFSGKNAAPVTYPIGIGREGLKTPVGSTTVREKKAGPTWRPTPRMRLEDPTLPVEVPPGAENPMGTHALYLGWPEYAIHGTNKPFGIGRRSSSGCIRMYPEDIVKVFPVVAVGETVTVVDQPVKAGWIGDKLYVEAHPTMAQANRMEEEGGRPGYEIREDDMGRIMRAAGPHAASLDWPLIRKVVRERKGYPIAVGAKIPGVIEAKVESNTPQQAASPIKPPVKKEAQSQPDKKTGKDKAAEKVSEPPEKTVQDFIPWLKKRGVNTDEKSPEKSEKNDPAKKNPVKKKDTHAI